MFIKIIRKSEGSYVCCYQKRNYTESIVNILALNNCA